MKKLNYPVILKVKPEGNSHLELFISLEKNPSWSNFEHYFNVFSGEIKLPYDKKLMVQGNTLYFSFFA